MTRARAIWRAKSSLNPRWEIAKGNHNRKPAVPCSLSCAGGGVICPDRGAGGGAGTPDASAPLMPFTGRTPTAVAGAARLAGAVAVDVARLPLCRRALARPLWLIGRLPLPRLTAPHTPSLPSLSVAARFAPPRTFFSPTRRSCLVRLPLSSTSGREQRSHPTRSVDLEC